MTERTDCYVIKFDDGKYLHTSLSNRSGYYVEVGRSGAVRFATARAAWGVIICGNWTGKPVRITRKPRFNARATSAYRPERVITGGVTFTRQRAYVDLCVTVDGNPDLSKPFTLDVEASK